MTKLDIAFWGSSGLSEETLRLFRVYPISRLFINNILKRHIQKKQRQCMLIEYSISLKYANRSVQKLNNGEEICPHWIYRVFEQLPESVKH